VLREDLFPNVRGRSGHNELPLIGGQEGKRLLNQQATLPLLTGVVILRRGHIGEVHLVDPPVELANAL